MQSKLLSDLDSRFRLLAEQLLERALAEGISLIIERTLSDPASEAAAIAAGRSALKPGQSSKHLPQPPEGKALAIDVVPRALVSLPNYAPADPLWWKLGEIGLALGLRWGGQWDHPVMTAPGVVPPWFYDPGHFEFRLHATPNTTSTLS